MVDQRILRVIAKFAIPFILMFGFYIQLHGDFSPGGGFQAGVVVASAFILYALTFGTRQALKVLPLSIVKLLLAFGALLYGSVGVVSILKSGNFLDYSVLGSTPVAGQHLGILIIELGVGITVFSSMLLMFITFARYGSDDDQRIGR